MRRDAALVSAAVLLAATAVLARRAGPSRESLLPLLRTAQDHGRQLERLAAQAVPLDADEERRVGLELSRRLPADGPSQPWVESLGRRLERAGRLKRYAGRTIYRTLPGPSRRAFALPGGIVVVSEGLIDRLEADPSRVAFVIGHELAHGELGHTADLVRYRQALADWSLPGGQLAQALRSLAALSFSEGDELEADRLSVRLLVAADLRPAASVEALERISPAAPQGRTDPADLFAEALTDYFRTHPFPRERLDRARAELAR